MSPTSTDWLWSNATHIYVQLSGWDDGGCDVTKWDVEYKLLGSNTWLRAENRAVSTCDYNKEDCYKNIFYHWSGSIALRLLITVKTILE